MIKITTLETCSSHLNVMVHLCTKCLMKDINVFYLFFLSLKLQEDLSTFDKKRIWDFNEAWINVNSFYEALPGGGGPMSPIWILKRLMLVFINACHLLSALPSLSQFGRGRLSLIAISFYALSLLFGPYHLSEFTLAGPLLLLMFPLPLLRLLPKLSIDSFRALLEF